MHCAVLFDSWDAPSMDGLVTFFAAVPVSAERNRCYIYIYIYVLEEGPPVGKHVLGSIFSNRRGEGEDTFLLCDQVLLADFLDFQMLFLVGWRARTFLEGRCLCRIFVLRQKTQGGEVRTLPVFMDFLFHS